MSPRKSFSRVEEIKLVKYLGKYSAGTRGRSGNALYKKLVENAGGSWPWAAQHSWQSWRNHYLKRKDSFDHKIAQWQKYESSKAAKDYPARGPPSPEKTSRTEQGCSVRQDSGDFPPIRTIEDQLRQHGENHKTDEGVSHEIGTEVDAAPTNVQPEQPQEPSAPQETSGHSSDQVRQDIELIEALRSISRPTSVQKPRPNGATSLVMEGRRSRLRRPASLEKGRRSSVEDQQDVEVGGVTSKSKGKWRMPDVSFTEVDVGETRTDVSKEGREYASRHEDGQASDTNAVSRRAERKRKASYTIISIPKPKRQRTESHLSPGSSKPSPSAHTEADNISHIVSEAFSMPAPEVAPQDLPMAAQIGLNLFFKAMSKNHGFTEDFVRRVYERRRSLRRTDLALAKARVKAERAALLESSDSESESDLAPKQNWPDRRFSYPIQGHPREISKGAMMFDKADLHELDLSRLREHRSSASNSKSRLLYTPGDEDASFAHEDDPYIPPSSSRAAKYLRAQKRKILTANSLRKSAVAESAEKPVAGPSVRSADQKSSTSSDSVQEEQEVLRSVIRPKAPKNGSAVPRSGSSNAQQLQINGANGLVENAQSQTVTPNLTGQEQRQQEGQAWTKEEDDILRQCEDNEQRRAILSRRGLFAAKSRLVELIDDDIIFS